MARGFLSGLIWGSVIVVGGLAVVSVSVPMRAPPAVTSTEPVASTPTVAPAAPEAPQAPQAVAPPEETSPPGPAAPEADSLDAMESADTAPTEAPDVGAAAPLAEAAAPEADAPEVATVSETPPEPSVGTEAPQAPEAREELTISTEPAQPTAPAVEDEPSGFVAAAPSVETVAPEPAPVTGTEEVGDDGEPAADPAVDTASVEQQEPSEVEVEVTGPAESEIVTQDQPAPAIEAPGTDKSAETEPAAPRIATLPRVGGGMTEAEDADTMPADTTAVPSTPSVRIGQRAGALTDRDTLPTAQGETDAPDETAAEAAEEPDPDLPPIERFAAPFDNPEDKPLMSIVLVDAEGSIGAEALANFPYPLTFAVAPDDPDAAAKMARHRAAGFEVLALIDIPKSATAQDAETALEVGLGVLAETVGVIEGTGDGLQGNRALSDQVTAVLRDQGLGFVTRNSGLNTVQKLAERAGVPSAFVFRDFDGAGQTPTVMRRFLDQAAFRAGQEGGVIMLGRVQPDTISALLLWGLQDRASRVTLAPVSAVLTMEPKTP